MKIPIFSALFCYVNHVFLRDHYGHASAICIGSLWRANSPCVLEQLNSYAEAEREFINYAEKGTNGAHKDCENGEKVVKYSGKK